MTTPPDEPRLYPSPETPTAVVVGVDLLERGRLERGYARRGERLLNRIFTPREIAEARGQIPRLESRFAAKEACAKALGVGIGKFASWLEIEVVRLPSGKPALSLSGGAEARARELGITAFDVSISDTRELVMAVVVGVRDPNPPSARPPSTSSPDEPA
ncbi:MAG TPA: holo-ACP synthase [Ktedonobacterales bacterium]|nr:holo-ACP synthase [Ktedonobacterales bacterium]